MADDPMAEMVDPLPDRIKNFEDAAEVARALGDHFDQGIGSDRSLTRIANALASICEVRAESPWDADTTRYGARVTFVDDQQEAHTAIVLEPEVASMGTSEAWDPNRGEVVDPREAYPLGTVQLVYPEDGQFTRDFFFDRLSGLKVATSVTPAAGPEDLYCYYPGWDFALEDGNN